MILNEKGEIVKTGWIQTSIVRPNVIVDEFIVMPNHLHGILIITDDKQITEADSSTKQIVGAYSYTPLHKKNIHQSFKSPSKTIGSIIRGFKSSTTKQINILRRTPGIPVWQRNYHEHIIRSETELK